MCSKFGTFLCQKAGKSITFFLFLILALVLSTGSASANAGGYAQNGAGNWDFSATITGNGPDDVVAVANKQLGKTRSTLGYTADWCAAFVNDVFKIAGQESAAPFVSGKTHVVAGLRSEVISHGGVEVSASAKQKGDLIFYYCNKCGCYVHVGICFDNGNKRIEGNVGDAVTIHTGGYRHYWENKAAGTSGLHYESNGEVTISYVRPNYNNTRSKLLHPYVFNASFYAAVNPDLSSMSEYELRNHWLEFGIYEGRCASPVFDIKYYKRYSDLSQAFGNDNVAYINHYVDNGINEGRTGSVLFDPIYYLSWNMDLQPWSGNDYAKLTDHFLANGISEYRAHSSPYFSIDVYRDNYADLQGAFGTSPDDAIEYLTHYLLYGINEGRISDHRLALSFNANGGAVTTESKMISFNSEYGVLPIPVRDGYTFSGWFTAASGGDMITQSTRHASFTDLTVYAQWTKKEFGSAGFILPANTVMIEANAFENNILISSVDAHNCSTIGAEAFKGCNNLTKIRLPKDCTIGADAFTDTALMEIYGIEGGTTESWANEHGILFISE